MSAGIIINKKNMFKKRIYFLVIILTTLVLIGAGCLTKQETTTETGQVKGEATTEVVGPIKVDLDINTGSSSMNYAIPLYQDSTVLDLLKSASKEYGLALEIQDSTYGPFVQALADKSGGEEGKYWLYYVNGEAAQVGVGEQIVKDGDKIEFRFE